MRSQRGNTIQHETLTDLEQVSLDVRVCTQPVHVRGKSSFHLNNEASVVLMFIHQWFDLSCTKREIGSIKLSKITNDFETRVQQELTLEMSDKGSGLT